jgi:hypothetical protein
MGISCNGPGLVPTWNRNRTRNMDPLPTVPLLFGLFSKVHPALYFWRLLFQHHGRHTGVGIIAVCERVLYRIMCPSIGSIRIQSHYADVYLYS